MPQKKVIHEKQVFCLKKMAKSLKFQFFGNNFFQVHFVTKVSLYFWNLQKITNFLFVNGNVKVFIGGVKKAQLEIKLWPISRKKISSFTSEPNQSSKSS
jgi:hypothetical protein